MHKTHALQKLMYTLIIVVLVGTMTAPCYALRQPVQKSQPPSYEETLIETISMARTALASNVLNPGQAAEIQRLLPRLESALERGSFSPQDQADIKPAFTTVRAICASVPITRNGSPSFREEILRALQDGRKALGNLLPGNRDYQALSRALSRLESASREGSYSIQRQREVRELVAEVKRASVPAALSRKPFETPKLSS